MRGTRRLLILVQIVLVAYLIVSYGGCNHFLSGGVINI